MLGGRRGLTLDVPVTTKPPAWRRAPSPRKGGVLRGLTHDDEHPRARLELARNLAGELPPAGGARGVLLLQRDDAEEGAQQEQHEHHAVVRKSGEGSWIVARHGQIRTSRFTPTARCMISSWVARARRRFHR